MDKSPEAFRTISEAADDLGLPQHVLRFWETRFPQIKPLKRGGGRRYYRPDDVELLRAVKQLLYDEGYTIKGVQRLFKEQGARAVVSANMVNHGEENGRDVDGPSPRLEPILGDPSSGAERPAPPETPMERGGRLEPTSAHAALSASDLQALRLALAEIGEGERVLALARAD